MNSAEFFERLRNAPVRTSSLGFLIGADLGQKRDPTAIATVEHLRCIALERDPYTHHFPIFDVCAVRDLFRPPLGTSYIDIVDSIGDQVRQCNLLMSRPKPRLVVDGTGLGAPVIDLIRRRNFSAQLSPVLLTGGERESLDSSGYWHVPKRALVSSLQILLEQHRLRFPDGGLPETKALVDELMNMRVKISPSGGESCSAWRDSDHDDLVFAVSLACWATRYNRLAGAGAGQW